MDYQRVATPATGLRLHLNEHTGGCSPRVIEALARLQPLDVSLYPEYDAATTDCAALCGVDSSWVILVNGLDEGIWAAAAACLRPEEGAADAVVPVPTFDMYAACVTAVRGRVVTVPPRPGFEFPLDSTLAAITAATRIVYLCHPNNPTGRSIDPVAISAIARAVPDEAMVFVDEAYIDFGGESFVPRLGDHPNVVVGRTFAKAYGLAALRCGFLVGRPEALRIVGRTVPPYSVNVAALVAMRAALADRDHHQAYCAEVRASRELIYEACRRLGTTCWTSDGNFVLVRIGDQAAALVAALAERRILVRNRSAEPGCQGCVRVTAGLLAHTRVCVAAIEEVLCDRA